MVDDSTDNAGDSSADYVPPSRDRVLYSLRNLELSAPYVAESFDRLHSVMALIEHVLVEAGKGDPRAWLSNDVAALSGLVRAYQGLQAAANLAVMGFYTEARATIRGVYESAGVARMLGHNADLADKWLRKNEWVPDRTSREFAAAMAGGDEEAKIPHQQFYKQSSASAHPSALTTIPYMFDPDGSIRLKLYPEFDAEKIVSLGRELTAEALFVAYCTRNALADPNVLSPEWHRQLATHAREFTGAALDHLDDDWEQRQKAHDDIQQFVRPAEEVDEFLKGHPNSLHNIKKRAGEASGTPE